MIADPPWDAATAEAIGVPWIERQLAPLGEFGRRARAAERAFVPGDEGVATEACAAVMHAATIDDGRIAALREALRACPDPRPIVARARGGDDLDDVDFFELARFVQALDALVALRDARIGDACFPIAPAALREALAPGVTPRRTFYLDDRYDAALGAARGRAIAAQAEYDLAHGRLRAAVAQALDIELPSSDAFIVMRDRFAGALPPGVHVVREAATYRLCELAADDAVVAALRARDETAAEVAECERTVRARLAGVVASAGPAIDAAAEALGRLDGVLARVHWVQRFGGCVPELESAAVLEFEEARYLVLVEELGRNGRRYTPVSIELDGVAVLTGLNMGGKTAALRACGFVAACLAYGIPPPAKRVRSALFDAVTWIGSDEGAREPQGTLLSSFGREVTALQRFLARRPARGLVLVDEFARTTGGREGRALAIALVESLRARDAVALVATHVADLAEAAGAAHFAVAGFRGLAPRAGGDPEEALRRIAEALDYRIVRAGGEGAARADALDVAELLGLDPDLVALARGRLQ